MASQSYLSPQASLLTHTWSLKYQREQLGAHTGGAGVNLHKASNTMERVGASLFPGFPRVRFLQ